MKLSNIAYLGLSTLLFGLLSEPAMGVTIDLFNDVEDISGEQFIIDNNGDNVSVTDTDTLLNGVLGGKRIIEVKKISPSGLSRSRTTQLAVYEEDGEASFSSASSTTGTFAITWDGDFDGIGTNNYTDLTEGGLKDSFRIDVKSNDLGVTLNFDVSDGTNTVSYSQPVAAGKTGDVYFPFAGFSNQNPLKQAKSIKLYSSNEIADLDFTFAFFESAEDVPFEFSPGLGIILGGSFLGFNSLRKKLKINMQS